MEFLTLKTLKNIIKIKCSSTQSITGYMITTPNLWIIYFIHICLADVTVYKCSLKRGDGFIGCMIFVLFKVLIIFNYFVPNFIFWHKILTYNIVCLNFTSHSILILLAYFHDKYIMYVLYLIHTIQNIHDILPIEMSNISCPYRILRSIYI